MRKWLILLIVVFAAVNSLITSAAEVPTAAEILRLAAENTPQKWPDADSVLLFDIENISYQPDGTSVSIDDFYQKVLNESGRQALRELTFYFNSNYGSAELETLEIIKPDGKVIPVDFRRESRVAVEPSQMGSNIYDPANKILTVPIPGLAVGDTIHVRARDTITKARVPDQWCDVTMLQADIPIIRYIVQIDAPASRPLRSIAVKDEVPNCVRASEEKAGDRIIYRWEADNVPQVIPEPGMPAMYSSVQRLVVSTAENWQEISAWYYRLCQPALESVNDAMREKVRELTRGLTDERARMEAIFRFVAQNIRYMGITPETESPGYEPHPVDMTFNQRYGVCRDKAALLAAMLNLAGFDAHPVLIMAGPPKDDEVPNNYFNHAVVAVRTAPGEYILMDPTDESTRDLFPAYLANKSYLVALPEGDRLRRSEVPAAEDNQLTIRTRAELLPNGELRGGSVLEFTGINDGIYRDALSRWPEEYRREFFAAQLKAELPGAVLSELEITPENIRDLSIPLVVKLKFSVPEQLPDGFRDIPLRLPELGGGFGIMNFLLGNRVGLEQRKFNLIALSTGTLDESISLKLPPSIEISALPGTRQMEKPGIFRWKKQYEIADGELRCNIKLALDAVEIPPDAYRELKEVLRTIDAAAVELPVAAVNFAAVPTAQLTRTFPGADSLLLADKTAIKVRSESEWDSVTTVKRRILTYAGVKRYSEIKVDYNPVWESVTLEASVTTASGEVRKLNEQELNLMDASWVGSAPRYPAGKILVASLPGVEPGAVIEYTLRRRRFDRHFFFASGMFASDEPGVLREFSITASAGMRMRVSPSPRGVEYHEDIDDGVIVRRWVATNTPQLALEPGQPPVMLWVPMVMASSGEFEHFAAAWNRALSELAVPDPEVETVATELDLRNSALKVEDKVVRIRDYVARKIRSAGPGADALPWKSLSAPGVTISSGYGDSADRAILIGALLKTAGIEFRFVAASSLSWSPEVARVIGRFPQNCFNSLLVYVPEGEFYLNSGSEYAFPGAVNLAGKTALELNSGRLVMIQPHHNAWDGVRMVYDVGLQSSGTAEIVVTAEYSGSEFEKQNRFFSEVTPENRRRHFEQLAAQISQSARIVGEPECNFDNYPGVVRYRVRIPHFAARVGDFFQFELPGFDRLSNAVITAGSSRKTPFWRGSAIKLEIDYNIDLPDGFVAVGRPSEEQEFGDNETGRLVRRVEREPGRLIVDYRLSLPVGMVKAVDYDKLEALQRALGILPFRQVVLRDRGLESEGSAKP